MKGQLRKMVSPEEVSCCTDISVGQRREKSFSPTSPPKSRTYPKLPPNSGYSGWEQSKIHLVKKTRKQINQPTPTTQFHHVPEDKPSSTWASETSGICTRTREVLLHLTLASHVEKHTRSHMCHLIFRYTGCTTR